MALVTTDFNINITPGAMPPVVHVSEYDIGRSYTVGLIGENNDTFTIPTGTTATIEGTLNGVVGFSVPATISNNKVAFTLTESMTAYAGKAWCKIKLTLNDEPIQTCAFIIAVDRAGVEAGDVIGAPGFDEQISAAVNAYLDANPVSGGISTAAKNLLITILRSGVYTADQSANITALDTALGGGTTEPEEPDVPVETTYAISSELINCTSSNSATSAKENAAYTATLTANDGYTLTGGTVTVTMGGVDITSTAYADGVISIASVTGDVGIFASAVVVQAEAALPEEGLIAYFDYRTTTYDNAGSGGKTTIAPTKGSGHLFMWANNSISAQNEYGMKAANGRPWQYDQNGGTNATALGNAFTVIQLTYGEAPKFGFNYANTGAYWSFYPQYINASGSTAYAAAVNGGNFNSDSPEDYNFTVFRADGATLTEIFDTSRTTYNGGDIDGFSRWLDTPYGNTITQGDNKYCTAMAIYNRALTDTEIEAAREFMKTLEVTA